MKLQSWNIDRQIYPVGQSLPDTLWMRNYKKLPDGYKVSCTYWYICARLELAASF